MSAAPAQAVSPYPFELGTAARYLLALALLAALLALRLALFDVTAGHAFMTFFPGVAVTVLLAGAGPALLYTVLAAFFAVLLFQPPHGALDLDDGIGFAIYAVSGLVTVLALAYYQRWLMAERERTARSMRALAEAQAQLRREFDETPLGIAHIGLDERLLRCNRRLCRMLGCGEDQLLATGLRALTHPDDLSAAAEPMHRLVDGRVESYRAEQRLRRQDGGWLWTAATVSLARRQDGSPDYLLVTIEDIDASRSAQKRLRVSEARFQAFMNAVPAIAWLLDEQGRFVYMNPAWERALGQPRELWLGRARSALLPSAAADAPADRDLLASGRTLDGIEPFGEAGGAPRLWRTVRFPVPAEGGGLLIGGMAVEITSEVSAQAALRDSEARLALALDSANMGSWQWEPASGDARWNRREFELLGLDPEQHCASQALFLQAVHPEDRAAVMQMINRSLHSADAFQNEFRIRHPDGEVRWLAAAGRASFDVQGRLVAVAGTNFDITPRKLAEQALRDSETRMLAIIDNASDAIISTDQQGRVTLFNPAAERMFGIGAAQMTGQPLDRLLPPEARSAHGVHLAQFSRSGVSQRQMSSGRVTGLHADGRRIELEASISQVAIKGAVVLTAMLHDVTERSRAERRLVAYQLELAGLNRRLLVQEKETTRRLAQSLHDDLGQTLAALRMQFDAGRTTLGPAAGADTGALRRIDLLISEANRQVRQVLTELRPPMLDELGLVAALENEMRRQSEAGIGPRLSLLVDDALRALRWPGDIEFAAFMVAREAIYNAMRHASASNVEVIVEGAVDRLELRVEDDGIGLPDDLQRNRPGHLGLVGMRERARSIGAALELGSTEGQGTSVHLDWRAERTAEPAPSGAAAADPAAAGASADTRPA